MKILTNTITHQVFLNGNRYFGKAVYINGYNGYTKTENDSVLCAVVNNSCWNNGSPNYLYDENGKLIHNENLRGNTIEII